MVRKYTNHLKHMLIHLVSFIINYLLFICLISFFDKSDVISIQIINLIAWIISMMFIFFVDKLFVPDLLNEHNSRELSSFILIRTLSLIIEVVILFIFVSIFRFDYSNVKLISLILLFFFNHFYVSRVKFN